MSHIGELLTGHVRPSRHSGQMKGKSDSEKLNIFLYTSYIHTSCKHFTDETKVKNINYNL